MMSTSISFILTKYYHIGFQQGGAPTQVWAENQTMKEVWKGHVLAK